MFAVVLQVKGHILDFLVDAVLKAKIDGEGMRVVLIGEPISGVGSLGTMQSHFRLGYRLNAGLCLNQESIL